MKTAVITGATSGIGNSILKAFLNDGYKVFAGYRDIRQKKDLMALSENVVPFRIDLTKKWTIDEAIKTINDSVEKIDVLVNVAGKVVAGPLENLPVNKIREQFEVNVFSHLELSQGLFKKLNGGKIINISSMASYGLFPFLAPYCASKKTMDMMFSSLRIETGSSVKIISVKPGVISTPLWQKSIDENKEHLGEGKYKLVGDFLISNAIKNASNGLNPNVVAKKVLKIANSKNPKTSYTIGFDAFLAKMVSKLPQKIIDIIVESHLVKKVKAQLKEVLIISDNQPQKKDAVKETIHAIYQMEEFPADKLNNALNEAIESDKQ